MAQRSLASFYSKFTAGGRPKSETSPLVKDGKYMFSIAPNNFFDVRFEFSSWLGGQLPTWARNDSYVNQDYIDNIGHLVQNVSLPGMGTSGPTEEIDGDFGKALLPPMGDIIPTDQTISIDFLNTEYSIFEYMLLPWLEETMSNVWNPDYFFGGESGGVPFARADIKVDFYDQTNMSTLHTYVYHDCYPNGFTTLDVSQSQNDDLVRSATFNFDYMTVEKGVKFWPGEVNTNIPDIFGNPTPTRGLV